VVRKKRLNHSANASSVPTVEATAPIEPAPARPACAAACVASGVRRQAQARIAIRPSQAVARTASAGPVSRPRPLSRSTAMSSSASTPSAASIE
jgi:hypothetical protein